MNKLAYDIANLLGLLVLTAGIYLLHGLGWALIAAGCQLFAINWATVSLHRRAGD